MRPIKFRAWDKEQKKFIRTGIDYAIRMLEINLHIRPQKTLPPMGFTNAEMKRFAIEQFTGLKDVNGEEIYEGDILAVKFNGAYVERVSWRGRPDCVARVIWDYSGFRLLAKGEEDSRYADWCDLDPLPKMVQMSLKHSKVIGNIHENPELLK